ncbi:MAG TPA: HPr family phosphocarrier protein [Gemmatimonadales bacterium]|nr:HPr family phosphocarrier protein [Gemmatimonadales bacterium]
MAVAERTVEIVNELGLHARPAAEFVKIASRFRSNIQVARDNMTVNGKSVLGVMTLAAERGSSLVIRAEGDDADAAVAALERLVRNGFHE